MFNFLKKKNKKNKPENTEEITFKIDGMHCTSCSMSVDGDLEELEGVISAHTKYANSTSRVEYDPSVVKLETLKKTITDLGYQVK